LQFEAHPLAKGRGTARLPNPQSNDSLVKKYSFFHSKIHDILYGQFGIFTVVSSEIETLQK
jgi:hypothetical protein